MGANINHFLFIKGGSCPSCFQALLSLNCLKLTMPWFPHNCLTVSCGNIGFSRKILSLVLARKTGFKVPFLPIGHSCPLQTILLSDLVWQPSADSNGLLGHHFCQQRAVTPDPDSLNSNKKGAKLPLLSAEGCHTRLEGKHCPLITYQGVFLRVKKPSDDINIYLFLMKKKELTNLSCCLIHLYPA